jgi:hypothetical protein
LRTRTLEAFKESIDKALEKEGFAVAVRDCTQAFMEKFDKGSEGIFTGTLSFTSCCLVPAFLVVPHFCEIILVISKLTLENAVNAILN